MSDGCAQERELLPEVALGIADGADRAAVLAHLEGCPSCRGELRRLSDAADGLAALAPAVDPPAGFAERAVLQLSTGRRRHHRWRWAAAAGMAAAVAASVALATTGGRPARPATLAGQLVEHGRLIGDVSLAGTGRPRITVHVRYGADLGTIRCEVVEADGRVVPVGTFTLNGGWGSWTTVVPSGGRPREAVLTAPGGAVLARAVLASTE